MLLSKLGIVLDAVTKKPIEQVVIAQTDEKNLSKSNYDKLFTSADGSYDLHVVARSCNEITRYFSKVGYETRRITFQNHLKDTVLLTPSFEIKARVEKVVKWMMVLG